MAEKKIQSGDLVFHFLNVGFGDALIVEFPEGANGKRKLGVVDCNSAAKTRGFIREVDRLRPSEGLAFVCATHPHLDHIRGIDRLLKDCDPAACEFWDSGFRHNSGTYRKILETVYRRGIDMKRVSSGMEWYFGTVRVTALAPSVYMRNRYATYGVDMNNASVVLRFENCDRDAVVIESLRYKGVRDPLIEKSRGSSVVILGGDAEFDSWARISQEYPFMESASSHEPLVKKMVNLMQCGVVKVSHHGSMHSSPLDIYERMNPSLAIISCKQEIGTRTIRSRKYRRELFPHGTTALALKEVGARVLTTDGSYEKQQGDTEYRAPGSITVVVPPGGKPRFRKFNDATGALPPVATKI